MMTYESVQSIIEKNRIIHTKTNKRNLLFQGFMFCKECGHTLGVSTTKGTNRNYVICNHYRKYSRQNFCTPHTMRYENIEEIVLKDVRRICKKFVNTEKLDTVIKNSSKKNKLIADIDSRILQARKAIENNSDYLQECYKDKLKGIITLEMYQEIAGKLSEEIAINQCVWLYTR